MNYEFSMNKKEMMVLLFGLGLLGVLLFAAGLLIGYGSRPSPLPANPFVAQNLSKVKLVPPAPAKAVSLVKPLQASPPTAGPASTGSNPPQGPANASLLTSAAAAPNPPPVAADPGASIATKASGQAPAADAAAKAYSIQMGAFLDPNNAARLVKNLKGLGYNATIFKAPDRRGRIWDAVRLGRFNDLGDAMRAASEFRTKEQIFALVRPANTL